MNATYIIAGVPKTPESNGVQKDQDDDETMQSSPYMGSSQPNQETVSTTVPKSAIILAREEDLDGKVKMATSLFSWCNEFNGRMSEY